jgi:4-hydroxy-4-methyl-2-oxoglutarate aldolase
MSAAKETDRAPLAATLSEALLALGTATVYEASGRDCCLPSRLRPAWPGARLVGRALPVSMRSGDNLALHLALEVAQPGDILVADAAEGEFGYWGEVLTVAAQTAGVGGLVIDGGVRDVRELERLRFPVFSSHVALRGTAKDHGGTVGDPVEWDGVAVTRGDVVVADADGVVVLPAEAVGDVFQSALTRQATEAAYMTRLREGTTTMQLYGFARPHGR